VSLKTQGVSITFFENHLIDILKVLNAKHILFSKAIFYINIYVLKVKFFYFMVKLHFN